MDAKVYAIEIVKKLVHAGYVAYFAGGWVRDYVMEHPSSDIDIATNAPPQVILDLFPHTIPVGLAFGVIIVMVEGHQFEVSTFRKDISYSGGRRPEKIELSTAEEDAKRRDFTINGMFYDPLSDKIYDYVQGMEDIKNGIIRTIGNPQERFIEDRLRMIRALRFATRFKFRIDSETQEAIVENANTLFPPVAIERVWQEFNKMASYPNFDHALIEMHRLGLLSVVFPSLEGVHLNEIKHRVSFFHDFPEKTPTILFICQLFSDLSTEELLEICLYLKISAKEIKLMQYYRSVYQLIQDEDGNLPTSDVEWVTLYASPHALLCLQVISAGYHKEKKDTFMQHHHERAERLFLHIRRCVDRKPLINSEILKLNGIPPGKLMGDILKDAEKLTIMHNMTEIDDVVKLMKQQPYWPTEN